jgi:hypothetical protein
VQEALRAGKHVGSNQFLGFKNMDLDEIMREDIYFFGRLRTERTVRVRSFIHEPNL